VSEQLSAETHSASATSLPAVVDIAMTLSGKDQKDEECLDGSP
jgi:hypothetical protein